MPQHTTPAQRLHHLEDRAESVGLEVKRTEYEGYVSRWPDASPGYEPEWSAPHKTYREALEYALDWDGRMPDEEES